MLIIKSLLLALYSLTQVAVLAAPIPLNTPLNDNALLSHANQPGGSSQPRLQHPSGPTGETPGLAKQQKLGSATGKALIYQRILGQQLIIIPAASLRSSPEACMLFAFNTCTQ